MTVYHRTFASHQILAHGFRNGRSTYGTGRTFRGVWVSDRPLDINEGADGDVLLSLDVPDVVLTRYEWVEDGKPYREFLVPARLLNKCGQPCVCDEDELPLPWEWE